MIWQRTPKCSRSARSVLNDGTNTSVDHNHFTFWCAEIYLSAAVDTIDHSILTERLQKSFGISGDAPTWVVCYLRQRNQQILIGDTTSAEVVIEYGIPQGSVLGPKLYSLYTKPLADVIRHHQLDALLCRRYTTVCLVREQCSRKAIYRNYSFKANI